MVPLVLFVSFWAGELIHLNPVPYNHYQGTPRAGSRDLRSANRLYRVFFDKRSKRELFRVEYGRKFEGAWLNYWKQGLLAHGDFNNDGQEDYFWVAGDDTSSNEVLILSSSNGYQKLDLFKALRAAWSIRYGQVAPDFALLDHQCDFALETSGRQLTVIATISEWGKRSKQVIRIPLAFNN